MIIFRLLHLDFNPISDFNDTDEKCEKPKQPLPRLPTPEQPRTYNPDYVKQINEEDDWN